MNGIACGPDGSIYLVSLDSLNRNVGSGEHALYAVGMNGSIRTLAKDFVKQKVPERQHPEVRPAYCRGMAADQDGNVFIAVTGSRCVMKLTQKGEATVVLSATSLEPDRSGRCQREVMCWSMMTNRRQKAETGHFESER